MRTAAGVLLNLLLLPFGYYFLKQPRRFLLFLGAALLLSLLTAALHLLVFQMAGPRAALSFLGTFSLLWLVFILVDTLRAASLPPADSIWFTRPRASWIVPLVLLLLFGAQIPISMLKAFFSNAHSIGVLSSMRPTLETGDYFYGTGLFHRKNIQRGDIVVFRGRNKRQDVKRVIGLPGEKITYTESAELTGGLPFFRARIAINGQQIEQECRPAATGLPAGNKANASPANIAGGKFAPLPPRICTESIENGRRFQVRETLVPASGIGKFAEVTLKENQYFVLADNRDLGEDSRSFGPITAEQILEQYLYTALALKYNPDRSEPADKSQPAADECAESPFRAACFVRHPFSYSIRFDRVGHIAD